MSWCNSPASNPSDPVNPAARAGARRAARLPAEERGERPAFLLERSSEEVHRCCCPGAAAPRTDISAGDVLSSLIGA